jgi:hypothetical protein
MNAREQGRRAARSLTTVLALSGVALAGGMGVAVYTGIEAAKVATVRLAGDEGSSPPAQQTAPSSSPSSPSSSPSAPSAPSSAISAGSGPSRTSSSGS